MASRTSARAVRAVRSTSAISAGCTLRGRAFDKAATGELGFEDDDGECVAEDVVQVAGDALAFGDGGEGDVFFLGGRRSLQSARFCSAKKMLPPPMTISRRKMAMKVLAQPDVEEASWRAWKR